MLSAGVVADANVLLSAVIGKAAARVFFDFEVTVHATEFNALEVEEYIPAWRRSTASRESWSSCNGVFCL
jgi:hypothetical protein